MPFDRRSFLKVFSLAPFVSGLSALAKPGTNPPADMRSFSIGDTRLDVFNIGDITLPLKPYMRAPEDSDPAAAEQVDKALKGQITIPMQDILVRRPGLNLMIDVGAYTVPEESSYIIEGYKPPPPLQVRLAKMGVKPEHVQHVVFTHRHWDHFSGTTIEGNQGKQEPLFPNATHYIQKADWDYVLTRIDDTTTHTHRVFTTLRNHELIQVVEGDFELAPGVEVIAAPGETPGHQAVRIEAGGEIAYLVGDMIHHPVEVEHPDFMVNWAKQSDNVASRKRIYEMASKDNGLIIASHIHELGRIRSESANFHWRKA